MWISSFRKLIQNRLLWVLVASHPIGALSLKAEEPLDFFEKKIRPVLTETCYSCHSQSAEKIKGGLLLDSKSGWEKGGDTGPAIVPGKPEESLIIKAIRYSDENLQMPPKGKKLSSEQIADIEKWVAMGAPDPRTNTVAVVSGKMDQSRKTHWAFQPIRQPVPPKVKNSRLVQTPIDQFIFKEIEQRKLRQADLADRRTLIRRATYDLTGLPPTQEEVSAFITDRSAQAFEKVIDRLLASPRYGERWGRHWLDVARYADTKGDTPGGDPIYPYAYSFRDYVIRAFNDDLPFNRFIEEQLAADLLDLKGDKKPLAGLGFITVGRRFLNNNHDTIDDRIDVMSQGFLGLTVACARCHDHKYDPIPTKDYYSIYGVFSSTYEPEPLLLGIDPDPVAHAEYLANKAKMEKEVADFLAQQSAIQQKLYRSQIGDYLLAVHEASQMPDLEKAEVHIRNKKLIPTAAQRWKNILSSMDVKNPVFGPWIKFKSIPADQFSAGAQDICRQLMEGKLDGAPVHPIIARTLSETVPQSLAEVAARIGKLFQNVDQAWQDLSSIAAPPAGLLDPLQEGLRQILYAPDAPGNAAPIIESFFDFPTLTRLRQLRENIQKLAGSHAGAPARGMVVADGAPADSRVFIRGNPGMPGAKAPRQFLEVLSKGTQKPFQKGSGRLELAQAITDRENPLTARVIVNRVWLHHFGAGLVVTPNDFGLRSDPPSHPELLDYLASWFMDQGWSMKKLHKHIMLSRAYQLSSDVTPKLVQLDQENRWLTRANKRRLDFESLRDTLLFASGRMDLSLGGKPVRITQQPFPSRRTVYSFIDRQELPGLFQTFDFANPDTTTPQRYDTTVPQQALFLMNSPFLADQVKELTLRPELQSASSTAERVKALYHVIYQRAPQAYELKAAEAFLGTAQSLPAQVVGPPIWQHGFGSVDTNGVVHFSPFNHFQGDAYTTLTNPSTPGLGIAFLNAIGGIPGHDEQHAVIRRWVAMGDGDVSISGEFSSQRPGGDGVRGRIVSSSKGVLGTWRVEQNRKTNTRVFKSVVQKGDTIDFVVDCRTNPNDDVFHWNPKIKYTSKGQNFPPGTGMEYDMTGNFKGPQKGLEPLTPLGQLAQVLLLSNELMFVD